MNNLELFANVKDVNMTIGEDGAYMIVEGDKVLVAGKKYDRFCEIASSKLTDVQDADIQEKWERKKITISFVGWVKK